MSDAIMTGTAFGTTSDFGADHDFDKAFDGDTSTSYLCSGGGICGIDLGVGVAYACSEIRFYPRDGFVEMANGQFEGSNDNSTWTTIYTIGSTQPPSGWNTVTPTDTTTTFRYFRYVSDASSVSICGEIEFHRDDAATIPAAPTNITVGTVTSSSIPISWDVVTGATGYTLQYDTVSTFDQGPTTVEIDAGDTQTADVLNLAAETEYFFRVRAKNASGSSDWGTAVDGTTQYVSATTLSNLPVANAGNDQTITGITATFAGSATGGTDPYTFAWEATTKPVGAAAITATGTGPVVTFLQAGDYIFTLTVTDAEGIPDTDTVAITVTATATTVTVTPSTATGAQQFTAAVKDQFGNIIVGAPVVWSLVDSPESLGANGLYVPTSTTVRATSGAIHGDGTINPQSRGGTRVLQ